MMQFKLIYRWKNCYFQVVKGDTCLENLSNLTHTEGSSLAKAKTAWLIAHEDCFAKPHNVDPLFVLFGTSNTISGNFYDKVQYNKSNNCQHNF